MLEYIKERIVKNVETSSFLLSLQRWAKTKAAVVSAVKLDARRGTTAKAACAGTCPHHVSLLSGAALIVCFGQDTAHQLLTS